MMRSKGRLTNLSNLQSGALCLSWNNELYMFVEIYGMKSYFISPDFEIITCDFEYSTTIDVLDTSSE